MLRFFYPSQYLILTLLVLCNSGGDCVPVSSGSISALSTISLGLRETTNSSSTTSADLNDLLPDQGWTQGPSGRGSLNILWSCFSVMILCSWSILCLNIPAPDETIWQSFCRRTWLTALGFLGPEFIFQAALGQWISARRSVKDFQEAGIERWELTHAFFANAGGFVLTTASDAGHALPLDARQLLYLVTNGHVTLPSMDDTKKAIEDRNKSDGVLRIISLVQTIWFLSNFSTRLLEHLVVTGLEITTVAFVFCSLGTTICWFSKPAGAITPIVLESRSTMSEIQGALSPSVYDHHPLECVVPREEWHWSRFWRHWINILRCMRLEKYLFVEYAVEAGNGVHIDRIENTTWYEVHGYWLLFFMFFTIGYSAIFLASWNEPFPTHTEGFLWRVSSAMLAASIVIYFIIVTLWCSESADARLIRHELWAKQHAERQKQSLADSISKNNLSRCKRLWLSTRSFSWWHTAKAAIRNNSQTNDPSLDVCLKAQIAMYICGFIYCTARTYLYIADLTQLRLLPNEAYKTVVWPSWFPHIA